MASSAPLNTAQGLAQLQDPPIIPQRSVQETAQQDSTPQPSLQRSTTEAEQFVDAPEEPQQQDVTPERFEMRSVPSTISSTASVPPPGAALTGKQEHYLKRELISKQTKWEVDELAEPTALQRFGAPFRSDAGEVAPEDSELPILRYIFVHHIRNFPFLNQAKEKEFWQDKLQRFLESFANKHISSAEDRLEQTKRQKLAVKAEKLVELMMVSGIPTSSGYEERIRFSEMEVVDRGANAAGLVANRPEGNVINGWDVNVAGVRIARVKRHVRHHEHAEFILRVQRGNEPAWYISRRFGAFVQLRKRLRVELPGKVLAPLPRKNKSGTLMGEDVDEDDDDSMSSNSIPDTQSEQVAGSSGGIRGYLSAWTGGSGSKSPRQYSARGSIDSSREPLSPDHSVTLVREEQRVSLRAFLRNYLQNANIAHSPAMLDFLSHDPIQPTADEVADMSRRRLMDERRLEEQHRFYEVASDRARELDVHMEKFRRKVVERDGLRELFSEIRKKDRLADLDPEYKKFAEWLRIEVAATLYHLFLAEDNSPDLFAQAKRIHSLMPYGALKQVIRFTNPTAVMANVLDLFMAQPLGSKSLLQRIFGFALGDGIKTIQKAIDSLTANIGAESLCARIQNYTTSPEKVKNGIRTNAVDQGTDLLLQIFTSKDIAPPLSVVQVERTQQAYVAWNEAVDQAGGNVRQDAELYAHLKQLLKLYTRLRDKQMMLQMIEEPNTLRLFRDLFTIFYEPLVRVYKSANVYGSVTDFARFADDTIQTVERAQQQDVSADPNQTVQSFIDLCERHEDDLYKFIHEVHTHDDGLFDKLMTWIEGILDFLRNGPRNGGTLDMNALFVNGVESGLIDAKIALREINSLIKWQMARKRWHSDKTRQKMASGGGEDTGLAGLTSAFHPSDFGLNAMDLQDLGDDDDREEETSSGSDVTADPIEAERRRRQKHQGMLKRTAGEPVKPVVRECHKLMPPFLDMLRRVLAE
ncbi:hypothetical protein K470DRAFT_260649 [Piedraia hortae CBS 480.64]|uniref:PX domain-containing protein n=1 Tax=Piedraia hortae CBS 480.64 TaxID=1314780 RepID=A0A6A7BS77_9PEZI|nr:hypothetical protein K470DRAFT_260649 [Piedraia hortae CBS 480.64]